MTTMSIEPAEGAAKAPNKMLVIMVLMIATTMQALDTTIVNVALPHMEASLGATQDQISWVLTSYIVAAAIMVPATAWLAGRFGRTRLLVASMAGFTFVSLLCGIAGSLEQMVVFRVLQGVFGAALMPLSQAILLDTFSRKEMGRAMAIWGMGVMVGPILGPTLGGFLTEAYSWRWCFYINLPLGILAVLGAIAFVPETSRIQDRKFDWTGFGFLTLAVVALQLALDRGENKGWFQSTEIVIEVVLAVFGVYMFVVHSFTARRPFLDLRIFKDRTFMVCVLLSALVGVVLNGSMILSPQLLQTELRYPVVSAGLLMGPRGFGTIAAMMLFGRIANRVDLRLMMAVGLSTMGLTMYLMSGWSLMVSASTIIWVGMLQGFAMGLSFPPMTTLAFSTLPTELRTEASGFFNLTRNIGGAIGISIVVSQLTELTQLNHQRLGEFLTPYRPAAEALIGSSKVNLRLLNLSITQQAGMVAYINIFLLLSILCVAFIPLLLLIRPPKQTAVPPGGAADAMAH